MFPSTRFLRRLWPEWQRLCARNRQSEASSVQLITTTASCATQRPPQRLIKRKSVSLDEIRLSNARGGHGQDHDREEGGRDSSDGRWKMFLTGSAIGLASSAVVAAHMHKDSGVVYAAKTLDLFSDDDDASDKNGKKSVKGRRGQFNFIADVVQEVGGALVYIEIKDRGRVDVYSGQPATTSNGSGFIVKEDGLILTNAHVVINKPRASVQVRLQDGRTFEGRVEDVDVKSDLATVRINQKNLPVMPLGNSATVRAGEFVIAMGSPLSLSNTITTGVVSSVCRQRAELGLTRDRDVPEYLQTDAAITFGNSGGPLVNLDGEAIGINSMKVTPGISFAIPIDYAKEFLRKSEEARKSGWNRSSSAPGGGGDRRYVGITMITINPQILEDLRTRLELSTNVRHGIVVFRVVRESPAEMTGILPGDIITHINGTAIHGSRDVYKFLESDCDLKMTVVRKHRVFTVLVKPEEG